MHSRTFAAVRFSVFGAIAAMLALGAAGTGQAGPTLSQKCESSKLKEAGKLAGCLFKEESKAAKKGLEVDAEAQDGCVSKFTTKIQSTETKAEGECPTSGDGEDLAAEITGCTSGLTATIAGVRFIDNGNGTVTDTQTGTIWEQKNAGPDCTNCDDDRTWAETYDWLSERNRDGYAGLHHWGLPSPDEILEILDCNEGVCTLDPIFGPTPPTPLWTSYAGTIITNAQCVDTSDGSILEGPKDDAVMGRSRSRIRNNAT